MILRILGFGGLMWCFLWFYFASDTPSRNRRITGEERKYIEESLKETLIKNSSQKAHHFIFILIYFYRSHQLRIIN